MDTVKNVGLIECGALQKPLYISPVSLLQGYSVRKVLSREGTSEETIKARYPNAELVVNSRDILEDNSIELVIVSDPSEKDMEMVGEALQAGKQIRII
jgi:scyllo-inositol 2-dehydrogenase (NADP+)